MFALIESLPLVDARLAPRIRLIPRNRLDSPPPTGQDSRAQLQLAKWFVLKLVPFVRHTAVEVIDAQAFGESAAAGEVTPTVGADTVADIDVDGGPCGVVVSVANELGGPAV